MDDDLEWADWNQARFEPLAMVDASLAERLLDRLVDGFLAAAGLSAGRRQEALQQAALDHGVTPRGVRILRARIPLGMGHPEYGWDGSATDAENIVDSMADTAANDVVTERGWGLATGWEADDGER